jgi:UDP-N-acetylmuramoyl-tripeptide--D-alanyl-D-alanine ligase
VIPLTLTEVAALARGRLEPAPGADRVTAVTIDSRRVAPGALFVAVGGGVAYVDEALARGAAAALVPDDAFAALAALGGAVRERSAARVVGITGSNGKTSTKDILAALLRPVAEVVAAERSFNNELGVPLTLCRLEPETEVLVLELAMRGFGQIAELAAFARPELAIVTNVGPAHLEKVGSLAGVVRAKGELVDALPPGGVAVVPADFPVSRADVDVRRFGPGTDSFVESFEPGADGARARFRVRGRTLDLDLSLTARHQASNTLTALLAFEALGFPLDAAREGAGAVELSQWRGDEVELPGGGLLINDCYNANPVSMRAALEHLVERAQGRRMVAVIGDMAELGDDAVMFHEQIGRAAEELGVDVVVAYGDLARHYGSSAWSPAGELDAVIETLHRELRPGDAVLVKASRSLGLERVAEALAAVSA